MTNLKKSYLAVAVVLMTVIFMAVNLFGGDNSSSTAVAKAPKSDAAETVLVKHRQGETAVSKNPERVLVFDLAILDILDSLGVEAYGVVGENFPTYLKKYESSDFPKVGSLFEPDYEAIHKIHPDLMIVAGRASAKFESLAKMGTAIDLTVDEDRLVESLVENTHILGQIFGKEKEAREEIAKLQAKIDALKRASADQGSALIVMTSGTKMSAFGPGSRFGVIHKEFGIDAAVKGLDESRHGESIHAEFIKKTDPEWLFVVDRDAAIGNEGGAEKVLDNELIHSTQAWSTGQVVYLDPVNLYVVGGGLHALSQIVEQLTDAYRLQDQG